MQKINFQNLPNTTTPVNATNLNGLQTNVENGINIFDLFDDTVGTDWQTMMRNKIDYCIAHMDSSKTNTSTFINGGWNAVNYGLGICSKIGSVYQLVWHSNVVTYYCIKDGSTYRYGQISSVESNGSGTINNSIISGAERNHFDRSGNIVTYEFTLTVDTWDTSNAFVTGLPKPATETRFMGLDANQNSIMRFSIGTDGAIRNAYSGTLPVSNDVIEGRIVYITSDVS